jgi:3-dehydroquinate synthase
MPACFRVKAASGDYDVTVAPGQYRQAVEPSAAEERVFLADDFFAGDLSANGQPVIPIVASETSKSLDRISGVVEELRRLGVSRKTTLVAVGGGVVQDITCFLATIYMRGLDWIYVPTTLLAMADSCIGGKSSINVGPYKNLVGAYCPPQGVRVDPLLVDTLSAEQRVAGLCEAAKICFCRGASHYRDYAALQADAESSSSVLAEVVGLSLAAKTWFIEVDEFDRDQRLLLNFGHTFGHAIEAASEFRIPHGVAVGVGMLTARAFGKQLGRPHASGGAAEALFAHIEHLLGQVPGLSGTLAALPQEQLVEAFAADKKHTRDAFMVIVVTPDDGIERLALPRDKATARQVADAFATTLACHAA